MGWTSPYLALLTSDDGPFLITQEQGSWVASLLPLGRLFGAIIGSVFVEYLGSKMALFITGLPLIFAWACITAANSVAWLYVFRLFSGNNVDRSPAISRGALVTFVDLSSSFWFHARASSHRMIRLIDGNAVHLLSAFHRRDLRDEDPRGSGRFDRQRNTDRHAVGQCNGS